MLSVLEGLKHGGGRGPFAERTVLLHAMLASCSFDVETATTYDWHGLRRGSSEMALLQYTVSGWGALTCGGKTQRVQPGQAMILYFPHDNRYWLPAESGRWEFLYVTLYGREIIRIWRELMSRRGPLLDIPPDSPVLVKMVELIRRAQAKTIQSVFDASARAYDLAMALLDVGIAAPIKKERPVPIQHALEFCRAQYRDPIGVGEMAAAAGYSRYHFSRVFKNWTGYAPGDYLISLRLRHAARRLVDSRLRVKEIADEAGFRDCNYFCRQFRKSYGVSPAQFRKTLVYKTP